MATKTILVCDVCVDEIKTPAQSLYVSVVIAERGTLSTIREEVSAAEVCGDRCAHALLSQILERVRGRQRGETVTNVIAPGAP